MARQADFIVALAVQKNLGAVRRTLLYPIDKICVLV